ncbi:glycosyltransferase [Burkholderia orbicola]|uniref:class I SAM-dependent methyltransferase n=2 Tax=Burkholderiaceae TaxID=119060 RepID=UPI000A8726E1|nr:MULTISPECIES: class I SAM-dependent methyltransferase [Burkholderia]EKS9840259.1 glycosyltransferase [Burkholderia cepacia]MBJ9671633.1 glycosyltransferase [Burkholderia cenocepacia]MBJ9728383.1 glycosyltransferase [Burkholderia cenocepacia]MBR8395270.1 glycosyltransferase [Burkholderia cenocepacia]MDN7484394.1 glycosyltransferase [Burkholderia orbicola]
MENTTGQYLLPEIIEALGIDGELFWEPRRLVSPGAWAGHIATAFWLVKAVQPRVLVELGTHSGNSYSAFCQAVSQYGLSTRCFAVDTWQGDEHAGQYDEDVFESISKFNDLHYAGFSKLLRMTFDEARAYFPTRPQGEIDLLHIDGLHTYEAVKHDFDTWFDALSDQAVVLFHDINVRERGFGVWQLWQELSAKYPSFEFDNSEGLGVLCIGAESAPLIAKLMALGDDPAAASTIRAMFAARGEAFRRHVQAVDLDRHANNLSGEIVRLSHEAQSAKAGFDERIGALASELAQERAVRQTLESGAEDAVAAQEALRQRIVVLEADLARAREEQSIHAASKAECARLSSEVERLEVKLSQQRSEYEEQLHRLMESELRERDQIVQSFRNSTSWRVTAPMRAVITRLRGSGAVKPLALSAAGASGPGGSLTTAPGSSNAALGTDAKAAMRAGFKVRFDAFLTSSGMLRFKRHAEPDVSILLIFYNSVELSYACLASIAEVLSDSAIKAEVIILDNASTDATSRLLDRIEGATIIRSKENLHFLKGTNQAAKEARGKYLLFLNNDALLMAGSLEAAIALCEAEGDIGAVGGRIILPDGLLQEAGSVVWQNGACTGYGRGAAPDGAEYMFRRDVDYCSGAFLLTPRQLFESLNAFDERYAPAYYEETDYCLRLWESGHRVVFDPDVVIMHYEFGSASTSAQALQLQQRNHAIFRERHAGWLREQQEAAPDKILWARAARSNRKKLLFIEDRVPHESLGSGYPRALELLCALEKAGADITLFPMFRHDESWPAIRRTVPASVEVMRDHSARELPRFLKERAGYYDAIVVCRPHNMEAFLGATNGGKSPWVSDTAIIYDAESLFSSRVLLERKLSGETVSSDEARKMIADEIALTRPAKAIISVSEAEKRQFESHGVGPVYVLGHAVEPTPTPRAFAQRSDFLFVGGIHDDKSPNADSLRWFVTQIWPRILEKLGADLKLHVVGYNRAASVFALKDRSVHLVGRVDELEPWYDAARVVIAPTRIAAGIPLKAHSAASYGVPMVTTRLIAEQLGWESGVHLLAEDDADAYADACVRLYSDEVLWNAVRANALERVAVDCSTLRFDQTVSDLFVQIPGGDSLSRNSSTQK